MQVKAERSEWFREVIILSFIKELNYIESRTYTVTEWENQGGE